MKRELHLFLGLLLLPLAAMAQTTRTVRLTEAGTLASHISEEEKYDIEELTLSGPVNGTDFRLLRDMAGNDWQGNLTEGRLRQLDLTDANIVEGGENYLETHEIYIQEKNVVTSSAGFIFTTVADVVPQWGFVGCNSLQDISLPQSATAVGEYAFYVGGLFTVTFGQNLRSIGERAFYYNINLTELSLPASLTEIDIRAFDSCDDLREIYSYIELPFAITSRVFSVYNKAVLYVPAGSYDAYATTACWSDFKQIEEFNPATGILSTVLPAGSKADAEVYSLDGRQMTFRSGKLPKGISVVGGRKIVGKN